MKIERILKFKSSFPSVEKYRKMQYDRAMATLEGMLSREIRRIWERKTWQPQERSGSAQWIR